ncbi:MAG: hypothetical protein J1F35_03115 [Erysipelotrichales bacterium]|nr:hypothetical protein [Erysipelotrichales bacterium]
MDPELKSSIKSFLKELKTRIELLSSNKVTENVDNANIDEIKKILSKYDIASDKKIKLSDIKKMDIEDLRTLLSLIGQKDDSINYLFSKFEEHLEKIRDLINNYISDFTNIEKNQTEAINEKIALYQKYIELFEKDELEEPFRDINEISKVIAEIGLPNEDKWRILKYIAISNNKTIKGIDPKLSVRVSECMAAISPYLKQEEISNIITSKLSKLEIDIDIIPTIAAELSSETGINETIIINIIASLTANSLSEKLAKTEEPTEQVELIHQIYSVLDFVTKLDDPIVLEAKEIRNTTIDFYNNSLINGITEDKIKEYLEKTVSELTESDGISREYAIELKEIAVLKPIYETLDTLELIDNESDVYKKAITVLKKLVDQYKLLEDKKNSLIKE